MNDEQKKRYAVITGAGSGLGRDIALGLAAKSYRVFGTAISSDEIAHLKKALLENRMFLRCNKPFGE